MAYVVGLAGVVVGGLALRAARRRRTSGDTGVADRRGRPRLAVALGLFGLVLGGLVVVTADGGVGTGNGFGGGIVAIALGLASIVLGGLAQARRQEVA